MTSNHRRSLALVGITSLALFGVTLGSLAIFTDSDDVGGNAFTAGTIILTTSPTTALVTFEDMLPGDSITRPLVISNDGTGDLRYAMTSESTDTDAKHLAAQMDVVIQELGTGLTCAAADGDVVYDGKLSAALIGDAGPGADTGDRDLASGADETLCVTASLDVLTGNVYQGAATTATLTFESEQVAHNP